MRPVEDVERPQSNADMSGMGRTRIEEEVEEEVEMFMEDVEVS